MYAISFLYIIFLDFKKKIITPIVIAVEILYYSDYK